MTWQRLQMSDWQSWAKSQVLRVDRAWDRLPLLSLWLRRVSYPSSYSTVHVDTGRNEPKLLGLPWAWTGIWNGADMREFHKRTSPFSNFQPSRVTNCFSLHCSVWAHRFLNPFVICRVFRCILHLCCPFKISSPTVSVWILTWTQGVRSSKHYYLHFLHEENQCPLAMQWFDKGWGSCLIDDCYFFSFSLLLRKKNVDWPKPNC